MMPRAHAVRLAGAALALALAMAAFWPRPAAELRETRLVFGTLVEIVIRDVDAARGRAALAEAGHLMQRLHNDWHAWQPGALGAINADLRAGRTAPITPGMAEILRRAQHAACASGGTFEPAIGGLVALWGFHSDRPEGAVPSHAQVSALQARRPRMADLEISDRAVTSSNPAVQIDLGGFGKGAALDAVAAMLRARGIEDAVLNAGGDVNVIGAHGRRPWRVAIRDPFAWGAVASIEMSPDETVYTSGNYERFFEHEGVRFSHILDPRTGHPVREIVSASVLHPSGAHADAAATALGVAGAADWPQIAADMGIRHAMLITDDGRVLASPEMAARLRFEDPAFAAALEVQPLPAARDHGCDPLRPLRLSAL